MNRDWINEARAIADELKITGFEKESCRILDAIDSGSTGGEILMALRWNLEEILKSSSSFDFGLRGQIEEISKGITTLLGG
jgi:hypothetical protein